MKSYFKIEDGSGVDGSIITSCVTSVTYDATGLHVMYSSHQVVPVVTGEMAMLLSSVPAFLSSSILILIQTIAKLMITFPKLAVEIHYRFHQLPLLQLSLSVTAITSGQECLESKQLSLDITKRKDAQINGSHNFTYSKDYRSNQESSLETSQFLLLLIFFYQLSLCTFWQSHIFLQFKISLRQFLQLRVKGRERSLQIGFHVHFSG